MEFNEIIAELSANGKPGNREGMERFAITADRIYGTGLPFIRALARRIRKEEKDGAKRNGLAKKLWAHNAHETKLLATIVAGQDIGWAVAEKWIATCQNWAEVDQLCSNLLWGMDGAGERALVFAESDDEWRKRTGFVIMAVLAIRLKGNLDKGLAGRYYAAIEKHSRDQRNFVRKAVNWALRHMGKYIDGREYERAVMLSKKLAGQEDRTARWIGKDALRELLMKGPPKPSKVRLKR